MYAKRTARHAEALFRDTKIPPMGRSHRVAMEEMGRPLGSPIGATGRQVVRERCYVARSLVAEDVERSLVAAVGPDTVWADDAGTTRSSEMWTQRGPKTPFGPKRRKPGARGSHSRQAAWPGYCGEQSTHLPHTRWMMPEQEN